tara:strand:- start:492 stop:725 length:234 start_codon:yes stop_codon:yes gene_type:complete
MLENYIKSEIEKLDKGIVATPHDRDSLESFAKANQGCMDMLLMQMGVNYGYKIALENMLIEINKERIITEGIRKLTE